jgi:hypothetical protein
MRLRYYVLMIIFLCQHWVLAAQPMVLHSPHHAAADCQPSPLLNVDRSSHTTDSNSPDNQTLDNQTLDNQTRDNQTLDNHAADKIAAALTKILNIISDTAATNDTAVMDPSNTDVSVTLASADDHTHVNHMHGHADLPLDSRLWSWPRQNHASQRQLPQFVGIQHTPPVPPPNAIPV